jgi:hypothetical protein
VNRGYLANMPRFIVPVLAIVAAIVAVGLLGIVAHYGLGIARGTIRADALGSAALIGVVLAGGALLKRNK